MKKAILASGVLGAVVMSFGIGFAQPASAGGSRNIPTGQECDDGTQVSISLHSEQFGSRYFLVNAAPPIESGDYVDAGSDMDRTPVRVGQFSVYPDENAQEHASRATAAYCMTRP